MRPPSKAPKKIYVVFVPDDTEYAAFPTSRQADIVAGASVKLSHSQNVQVHTYTLEDK